MSKHYTLPNISSAKSINTTTEAQPKDQPKHLWRWGLRVTAALLLLHLVAIASLLITEGLPYPAPNSVQAGPAVTETLAEADAEVIPPIVPVDTIVIADARILPARHVNLSMPIGGIVSEVLVKEGETVEIGTPIVRLKNAQQRAAVAQAQAEVLGTQARLDELLAGTRRQEIASAQAKVDAANARLATLQEGARSEEVVAVQARLNAAQAESDQLYNGPEANALAAVQADLANAEAKRSQAQSVYNEVKWHNDIGQRPESFALQEATNNYDAAKARYDALFVAPNADAVANANATIQQAQADLDRLLAPATRSEIAEVEADLRRTQADLDLLIAGSRNEAVAAAEAEVAKARAVLAKAQADLDDTELRAVFAGTVASVDAKVGQQITAGSTVANVADLSAWIIETYDLTELDVVHVEVGDQVMMTVDAIDGLELTGRISYIKAVGDEKEGAVTYTAIIQPEKHDPRLRWNMSVMARFE